MGADIEIKEIENLLSSLLVGGKKLVSYEHQRLLATGENYGSTMLKLKLNLKDSNGEETVDCVAKLVPPSPFLWKMFNIPVTFKKEVEVYKIIGPTLNDFGREHGIENLLPIFPDYVGARLSLDPKSDEVDHDAVLILKNLLRDGYVIGDRFTGFDRDTTILLLKGLATLHASVIAYKLAKPEEFRKNILLVIEGKMDMDFNEETLKKLADQIKDGLSRNEKCVPLIDKVLKILAGVEDAMVSKPREPFGTLVHNDFWTNNMMVKYENGKPISTKFLDFQIVEYDNPANDVLFLLYSSTRIDLLQEVDKFLMIYFDHFIYVLTQLHCDTTLFSKEAFFKEILAAAPKELIHVVFMLQPLLTKRGEAKELSEMRADSDLLVSSSSLHENYYPRLQFVVQDFFNRKWV